jgi:hypothetical protein
MARTTATAVQDILGPNYDGVSSLTPFIDAATDIVTWLDSKDTGNDLSTATLELIERWLSAHFYAQSDPILQSKSTGRSSGVFQGQTAMGLMNTNYGQQALLLDASGNLGKRGKTKATLSWLGKAPSTQIDFADRD